MDSEPEEGEIRDSVLRDRFGEGTSTEDERPKGYRVGRIRKRRQVEVRLRSISPIELRRKSRELPEIVSRKRLSVSITRKASRIRGNNIVGEISGSGSKRSQSGSRGSTSETVQIRRVSENGRGFSTNKAKLSPLKRRRNRGQDFARNLIQESSRKQRHVKIHSRRTREKLMKENCGVRINEEIKRGPRITREVKNDLMLASISPVPLNSISTLENVEDVSEDELASVPAVYNMDREPELIVLDSASSSDSDEEQAKDDVIPTVEEEEDLEELELRKKALEGLVRKLDPSETPLESSITCDNNLSSVVVPVPPDLTLFTSSHNFDETTIPKTGDLLQNRDQSTSLEEIDLCKSHAKVPDDSEKENELELYLLRQKLLSDLAKKAKKLPSALDTGSELPSNSTTVKNIKPHATKDYAMEVSSEALSCQRELRQIPYVNRPLPSYHRIDKFSTRTENSSVSTGREHELPTSYSYAPLPVGTGLRSVKSFSISVTKNSNKRTVVSHGTNPMLPNDARRVEVLDTPLADAWLPKQNSYKNQEPITVQNSLINHGTISKLVNGVNTSSTGPAKRSIAGNFGSSETVSAEADKGPSIKMDLQNPHPSTSSNKNTQFSKRGNNLFSIQRTVMNPQPVPINKTRYQIKRSTHIRETSKVTVPRFPPPKKYKSIVIPLRDCDTSSDEEVNYGLPEPQIDATSNQPVSKTSVPLGDAFHSSLDNFLKTVRETASKNQALAALSTPATGLPETSQSTPKHSEMPTSSQVAIVTVNKNLNSLRVIQQRQSVSKTLSKTAKLESDIQKPLCTKEDQPEQLNLVMDSSKTLQKDDNTVTNHSTESNSSSEAVSCEQLLQTLNTKSGSESLDSLDSSVQLTAVPNLSITTSKEKDLPNQASSSNATECSKHVDSGKYDKLEISELPIASILLETPVATKSLASTQRSKANVSGLKTTAESMKPSLIQSRIENTAQTRQELQLREKLLRVTLLKSEKKLKLTNNEKELVDTRHSATELMTRLLEKVVKFSEKEKLCSDLEKSLQRIKRQFEMVERNLHSAKRETSSLQDDFLKSAEQAFTMRKKSVDLGNACRVIGKQIMGDDYRVPSSGAEEMLTKMKEIHKHSTIIKKLKAGSLELIEIDKQVQAAIKNPTSGRNTNQSSAAGTAPNKSLINELRRQENSSSLISSDEENWNIFKSQGLTKCLRTASNSERIGISFRPTLFKIKDVMQPVPLAFGIYTPYNSPLDKSGVNLQIQVAAEPVCLESIASTCNKLNCKLQHL